MRAPMIGASGLAAVLALTMAVAPLAAQEWHASAQAGRIRSALEPAASESFALGLQYDDPTGGLRLTGGAPIGSVDALRGGIGGWKRLSASHRGLLAGIDLSGNGFFAVDRTKPPQGPVPGPFDPPTPVPVSRSGHAFAGQAMPVLGYERPGFQLHARAGVSRYAATFGGQDSDRSVGLADLQLTLTPASAFAIVPVVRWFEAADERSSSYAGVSAVSASALGSVWGSVGRWTGGRGEGTPWAAGGRLRLHPRISLDAGVRHDAFDPLYLQPAQTSWSVGLSVLVVSRIRSVSPPVPAAYVDGHATIRLPVSASRTPPSIAGDFNAWTPAPMERQGDQWTYTVAVPRGVYNYSFVSASGEWFVPDGVAGRKDDGMGGHVAVLVVR